MRLYLIDLDGTIFKHKSNDLLPGARELLDGIVANKDRIIFITRRGDLEFEGHPIYSEKGAREGIRKLSLPDGVIQEIIFNAHSPRIVINDDGAFAFNHETNAEWTIEEIDSIINIDN